jgi:putative ABC transport system permease protein
VTTAPVLRAASAGAVRRLVQSAVVFLVLGASSAAALLGLALLATASEGFYATCAVTHCAQLAVTINAADVTTAELDRTRQLPGVTQAAGPYPQATITLATSGGTGRPAGGDSGRPAGGDSGRPAGGGTGRPVGSGIASAQPAGPAPASGRRTGGGTAPGGSPEHGTGSGLAPLKLTVVGLASPSGPLDRVVANPSIMDPLTHDRSRWPARRGEISLAILDEVRLPLGSKITVTSGPGKPELTIVGYADPGSVSYEEAWVAPSQIPALRASGAPAQEQVLYAFTSAATAAQINADLAEIRHALPSGAVAGSQSWLPAVQLNSQPNVNTPFVLAFAVLGLVLAVLVTANVVSAAVIASYRRIGVLKSIGFTPAQVTAAYVAQIGVPALAGAIAGTALGSWQVLPVIGVYPIDGEHLSVPAWIHLTVPLAMLALTGLAAAIPALRAGRLSAVAAIAAGQAPPASPSPFSWRGYAPYRLAGRLALPRPVTIGLAAPFSRPARSAVTLAALTFGLAGVVLAASLNASIHKINHSSVAGLGQIQAEHRGGRLYTLTPSQNTKLLAAIRAQPGTLRYVAEADLRTAPHITNAPLLGSSVSVGVAGRPGLRVMVHAYRGGSSWLGWNMITGRWYDGPHQVDATQGFLAATGRAVGDNITLTVNGKPVTARIVGEVFTPGGGTGLFTSWQALGGTAAGLAASHYDIALKPGTGTASYISALARALGPGYDAYPPAGPSVAGQIDTSFFHLLALLVAVLAGLGVLNSVLMATRERVHDLGVFKAVGMTPWQTLAMVIGWVAAPTIVAAAIALPAGLVTQDVLVRQLAAGVGMLLPASFVHVLGGGDLVLLALAGLGIAILGALGPAIWAATARTTTALRAE